MPAEPPKPPSNPFLQPSVWPASSRAGLRITPGPDLTGRAAAAPESQRRPQRAGVVTGAAVPGADPFGHRAAASHASEGGPLPHGAAAQPERSTQPAPRVSESAPDATQTAAELRARIAAVAAARAAAGANPGAAVWTPPVRQRRRNRRLGALLAYGVGAAAVVFAVGLVFTVVQRRAEIAVAPQAPPVAAPVEAPEALPLEPAAPEIMEASDDSLRGDALPAEPQIAMARVGAPSAAARPSPPRRPATRAAEPPLIRPPPPAVVPSPLDEPEAPLLDLQSPQAP